jgi:hypothetical protein
MQRNHARKIAGDDVRVELVRKIQQRAESGCDARREEILYLSEIVMSLGESPAPRRTVYEVRLAPMAWF